MRPPSEVEAVARLIRAGLNDCAIARATGINRRTICDWRHDLVRPSHARRARLQGACPICGVGELNARW